VNKQHNAKRLAAGMAAMVLLALAIATARPGPVAASNDVAAPAVASIMATVQVAAGQAYTGTLQFATDMRSLYNVYQLQSAAEVITASAQPAAIENEAELVLCEIFPKVAVKLKKKCRT